MCCAIQVKYGGEEERQAVAELSEREDMQQTIKIKHRRKKIEEYREVKNFDLSVSLWQLLDKTL